MNDLRELRVFLDDVDKNLRMAYKILDRLDKKAEAKTEADIPADAPAAQPEAKDAAE